MEKAFDHIIADYAGNKVKVNGTEHLIGECCIDLLNCFNDPDEQEALGDLSEDILADSVSVEYPEATQDQMDVLRDDILSFLRLVKDFRLFVPFAAESQLEAIRETFSGKESMAIRSLYQKYCVLAQEAGISVRKRLLLDEPDFDVDLFLSIIENSNRLMHNMVDLYGECYQDLMFAKRKVETLAEFFMLLQKPDVEHLLMVAFFELPKVATPT